MKLHHKLLHKAKADPVRAELVKAAPVIFDSVPPAAIEDNNITPILDNDSSFILG